ncbi:MAG: alpha-glucosidase [Candidatus Lokiarchaeota archaeon]|nr:alpha-glucosidase [Candidatus Lokiarchaeota archaeon]MBD3337941.1 alpha-glucosidase [Candidatus Lokiarchaeota archaeon]
MLKVELIDQGFKIFYGKLLFFHYTHSNPCFKIGSGTGKFRRRVGHFKIRENNPNEFLLDKFEFIDLSPERIIIVFSNSNLQLEITFKIIDSRLEIFPQVYNNKSINRFWLLISALPDERIYGGGAHFSKLNLRGVKIRLWTEEFLYSTYYPQTSFISSSNYFCHIETTSYSEFNFEEDLFHELYIWNVPEKIVIAKYESILSVVSNLTKYIGKQPEFPDWVYNGVILGIQGGKDVVEKKLQKTKKVNMKVSAVWCQDWQGYRITNFGKNLFWNWKYDEDLYPGLPSYCKALENRDIKFLGYMNPFLALDGNLFKEAAEKGYCVKEKNGNAYEIDVDELNAGLIDLTNPDAVEWYKKLMKKNLIDMGLSGWMHDYGEYLPTDAVLYSGVDAKIYHNQYAIDWAKIVYEVLKENNLLNQILIFNRAGYSHASKYIMLYWPGDQIVDWTKENGMAADIPIGITLGLSGIGYYHYDIGGFITMGPYKRTKEIFMRWAEMAAFTMAMRTHEGVKPDVNWQFDSDQETLEHFAKMIDIHVKLKPYLTELSNQYQKEGIPPIRACFLHYEGDPELYDLKYQYLFGRDLLVAPVFEPKRSQWNIYLPDDEWIHIWTEKSYKRGWCRLNAPIGQPPIFYRKGSEFAPLFETLKT